MENINIFDLVVVALITVLGLKGLFRGFTKEFFALVGIVGGIFIASRLSKDVGAIVNGIIPMENDNTIVLAGFIVTLVIVWIIAYSIGSALATVFKMSGLGIFDKIFGFAFGAGKIFLLFSIISYAVSQVKMINDNLAPKLETSIVFPILQATGSYIVQLDTSGFQQEVTTTFDDVVDVTKESIVQMTQDEVEKQAQEIAAQIEDTKNENK